MRYRSRVILDFGEPGGSGCDPFGAHRRKLQNCAVARLRKITRPELRWGLAEPRCGPAHHDFDSSEHPLLNENVNDLNRYCTGQSVPFETTDRNRLKTKTLLNQASIERLILPLQVSKNGRFRNSIRVNDLEPPARIELATC